MLDAGAPAENASGRPAFDPAQEPGRHHFLQEVGQEEGEVEDEDEEEEEEDEEEVMQPAPKRQRGSRFLDVEADEDE